MKLFTIILYVRRKYFAKHSKKFSLFLDFFYTPKRHRTRTHEHPRTRDHESRYVIYLIASVIEFTGSPLVFQYFSEPSMISPFTKRLSENR